MKKKRFMIFDIDYFSINRNKPLNIMKNFEYCLWLMVDDNHIKKDFDEMDFPPHISIETNLKESRLVHLKLPQLINPITIKLGKLQQNFEDEFFAFYYPVDIISKETPTWWNDNMHLSVLYAYHKKSSIKDLKHSLANLEGKEYTCSSIKLYNCKGHYTNWREHNIKKCN